MSMYLSMSMSKLHAKINHPCHLSNTDLEPINGTAVDERWELSESVSEGITDGAHSEDNVKLISDSRYEEVKQSYE